MAFRVRGGRSSQPRAVDLTLSKSPKSKPAPKPNIARGRSVAAEAVEQLEVTCAICFDGFQEGSRHEPVILKCGHMFGRSCIESWVRHGKHVCPQCKKKCTSRDFRVVYGVAANREGMNRIRSQLEEGEELRKKNEHLLEEVEKLKKQLEVAASEPTTSDVNASTAGPSGAASSSELPAPSAAPDAASTSSDIRKQKRPVPAEETLDDTVTIVDDNSDHDRKKARRRYERIAFEAQISCYACVPLPGRVQAADGLLAGSPADRRLLLAMEMSGREKQVGLSVWKDSGRNLKCIAPCISPPTTLVKDVRCSPFLADSRACMATGDCMLQLYDVSRSSLVSQHRMSTVPTKVEWSQDSRNCVYVLMDNGTIAHLDLRAPIQNVGGLATTTSLYTLSASHPQIARKFCVADGRGAVSMLFATSKGLYSLGHQDRDGDPQPSTLQETSSKPLVSGNVVDVSYSRDARIGCAALGRFAPGEYIPKVAMFRNSERGMKRIDVVAMPAMADGSPSCAVWSCPRSLIADSSSISESEAYCDSVVAANGSAIYMWQVFPSNRITRTLRFPVSGAVSQLRSIYGGRSFMALTESTVCLFRYKEDEVVEIL